MQFGRRCNLVWVTSVKTSYLWIFQISRFGSNSFHQPLCFKEAARWIPLFKGKKVARFFSEVANLKFFILNFQGFSIRPLSMISTLITYCDLRRNIKVSITWNFIHCYKVQWDNVLLLKCVFCLKMFDLKCSLLTLLKLTSPTKQGKLTLPM